MNDIIERISTLLEKNQKTQKDLMTHLGKTSNLFTDWKSGRVKSYKKYLSEIADYFNVSVDYLLGKESTAPSLSNSANASASPSQKSEFELLLKKVLTVPVYDEIVMSRVIETASAFCVPADGFSHPVNTNKLEAGISFSSISELDDYEEFPVDKAEDFEYVALRIHGDALEPRITEGDVVIVRVQHDVESGDLAVVTIGMNEFTCKKVQKTPEGMLLISTNPKHEPVFYSNQQIEEQHIRIFGKIVELRAKF